MADEDKDVITLGEKEYSQEELSKLVDYGNKYQEFEKEYDTDPKKAWSAYGKMSNEIGELREKGKEADKLKVELEELKSKPGNTNSAGELTPEAIREAKAAARKLDILTKDDIDDILKERGYVKQSDVDNSFASREGVAKFKELEGKHDGSDGLPKFDQDDMLSYMERNRVSDPEMAYRMKNADKLAEYRAEEIMKEKYPSIVTSKAGADDKKPKADPVTKDNLSEKLMEKLYPQSF